MIQIEYKAGYKYQLHKAVIVQVSIRPGRDIYTRWVNLAACGVLHIAEGYAWDGATGAIDTATIIPASLVHDALYQLMRLGKLDREKWRDAADREYQRLALECGTWEVRADVHYRTLRRVGARNAQPKAGRPILYAPRLKACQV